MKRNTNSNIYTFLYASIMVLIVATVLSVTALGLKDRQNRNKEIEKKQNILKAAKLSSTASNAEDLYNKYIVEAFAVNLNGEVVSENKEESFRIDLKKQAGLALEKRKLPVFVFRSEEIGEKMIIPVRGKGMWGPIWGYLSIDPDGKTIYGATFDHQGETPGLGAEIANEKFQESFTGKQFFDETGKFTPLVLVKAKAQGNPHQFDAVSGGTVTSKGLESMLHDNLKCYEKFLKSSKK